MSPTFTTTASLPDFGDDPVTLQITYSQEGGETYIEACTIDISGQPIDVLHKLSTMQKWRIEEEAGIAAAEGRIAAQESNREFRNA